jgi:hypothetical protein
MNFFKMPHLKAGFLLTGLALLPVSSHAQPHAMPMASSTSTSMLPPAQSSGATPWANIPFVGYAPPIEKAMLTPMKPMMKPMMQYMMMPMMNATSQMMPGQMGNMISGMMQNMGEMPVMGPVHSFMMAPSGKSTQPVPSMSSSGMMMQATPMSGYSF